MKLLRWAAAGASAYVIYKYSIGKKAAGEDVFDSPERALAESAKDAGAGNATKTARAKPAQTKPVKSSRTKPAGK